MAKKTTTAKKSTEANTGGAAEEKPAEDNRMAYGDTPAEDRESTLVKRFGEDVAGEMVIRVTFATRLVKNAPKRPDARGRNTAGAQCILKAVQRAVGVS